MSLVQTVSQNSVSSYNNNYRCLIERVEFYSNMTFRVHVRVTGNNSLGPLQYPELSKLYCNGSLVIFSQWVPSVSQSTQIVGYFVYNTVNAPTGSSLYFEFGQSGYSRVCIVTTVPNSAHSYPSHQGYHPPQQNSYNPHSQPSHHGHYSPPQNHYQPPQQNHYQPPPQHNHYSPPQNHYQPPQQNHYAPSHNINTNSYPPQQSHTHQPSNRSFHNCGISTYNTSYNCNITRIDFLGQEVRVYVEVRGNNSLGPLQHAQSSRLYCNGVHISHNTWITSVATQTNINGYYSYSRNRLTPGSALDFEFGQSGYSRARICQSVPF